MSAPRVRTEGAPRSAKAVADTRSAVSDRFRPDIEGMRAVAVGLVLLFHGFHAPFTGGYVGVDVFFVISGFLITGLLLAPEAAQRPDFHIAVLRPPAPPYSGRRPRSSWWRQCSPRITGWVHRR
jgi:hypothetical protein